MINDFIPEWFDLENYCEINNFSIMDWYLQIARRMEILKLNTDIEISDEDRSFLLNDREHVRSYGLFAERDVTANRDRNTETHASAVRPTTCFDIMLKYHMLPDELQSKLSTEFVESIDQHKDTDKPFDVYIKENDWGMEQLGKSLQVNLNATDEVLIQDFKNWLSLVRTAFEIKNDKFVTYADIKSWQDNQVLPYLDLLDWMNETGTKISKQKIAKLLFPNTQTNEYEKLRNGTERIIKKFKSDNFLESFWLQVKPYNATT